MNKLIYLDFSIIDISKITLIEFWYNYVKPKYGQSAELWQKVFTLKFQNMLKGNLGKYEVVQVSQLFIHQIVTSKNL